MMRVEPGSLKCVLLAGPDMGRSAMTLLEGRIGAENVRAFGEAAALVHTAEDPSALRNWFIEGNVLVVEFEKWSGRGVEVPDEWLLARGH